MVLHIPCQYIVVQSVPSVWVAAGCWRLGVRDNSDKMKLKWLKTFICPLSNILYFFCVICINWFGCIWNISSMLDAWVTWTYLFITWMHFMFIISNLTFRSKLDQITQNCWVILKAWLSRVMSDTSGSVIIWKSFWSMSLKWCIVSKNDDEDERNRCW